jgi:hypothetical protein
VFAGSLLQQQLADFIAAKLPSRCGCSRHGYI